MKVNLLSSVEYASLLEYSVHGQSEESQKSRDVRNQIKRGDSRHIRRATHILPEQSELANFFGPDVLLVPAPGHAPLPEDSLWVPRLIAEAMPFPTRPMLSRHTAVNKSAFASSQGVDRPDAQTHCDSMQVESPIPLEGAKEIVVIDDFTTTGATLLACASLLKAAFPKANVKGFALVRARSSGDIDSILAPHVGRITLKINDRTLRE